MTPGRIRTQVALERAASVRGMLDALRRLPASDLKAFLEDERTPAAAESYLRRAIEGLLDLGRHILAKAFGEGVVEYKAIAAALADHGVVPSDHRVALLAMAGYRNRLTHFYDEVKAEELHTIIATPVVWAEVRANFPSDSAFEEAMNRLGIQYCPSPESAALEAGRACSGYRQAGGKRQHLIPDFLVASHALMLADRLLTRDRGFSKRYFEKLDVWDPSV